MLTTLAKDKMSKTLGMLAGFVFSSSLHTIAAAALWGAVGLFVKSNPNDGAVTLAVIAVVVGFSTVAIFDGFFAGRFQAGLTGRLYTRGELEHAKEKAFAAGQQSMAATAERQRRRDSDLVPAGMAVASVGSRSMSERM